MTARWPGQIYFRPFNLSRRTGEQLNVTTLRRSSIRSPPVTGRLPLRSLLSLTQNFPKPLMRTSSPSCNKVLMIFRRDSMSRVACELGRSRRARIESLRWALVMVIGLNSLGIYKFSISSGTVGFSCFSPALSKPVVVAWLIFGVLPKPWRSQ